MLTQYYLFIQVYTILEKNAENLEKIKTGISWQPW